METPEGVTPAPQAIELPADLKAVLVEGTLLEPDYHSGEILFIAPDEHGQYVTEIEGRVVIVGQVKGILHDPIPRHKPE